MAYPFGSHAQENAVTEKGKREDGERTLYPVLGLNPSGSLRNCGGTLHFTLSGMAWAGKDRISTVNRGAGGRRRKERGRMTRKRRRRGRAKSYHLL